MKSWTKRAPKTLKERRALLARCGAAAFLDPRGLKFPIMAKSGACAVDCAGAEAAYKRARQFHHGEVAKKARTLSSKCAR